MILHSAGNELYNLMNGKVKKTLKIEHPWGNQNTLVFYSLLEDNMKPVINQGILQKNYLKRLNVND